MARTRDDEQTETETSTEIPTETKPKRRGRKAATGGAKIRDALATFLDVVRDNLDESSQRERDLGQISAIAGRCANKADS